MNSLKKWRSLIFVFIIGSHLFSCEWGTNELEVMYTDSPGQWYRHPAWSPTGEWIAYEYYGIDSLYGIWFIRPDGSDAHFVTRGHLSDFSPDGKKMALVRGKKIFVYELESKEITQLTFKGNEVHADWSPAGKHIAYLDVLDDPPLLFMDANGDNKRPLVPIEYNQGADPRWFSDYRILFVRGIRGQSNAVEFFVMDTTGQNVIQLTQSGKSNNHGKISPDGSKIVWQRWDVQNNNDIAVWMMNSDGSNKIRLTEGWQPDWSPDGKKIIYRKDGDYVPGKRWDENDPKVRGSLWMMNIETRKKWQFLPPD